MGEEAIERARALIGTRFRAQGRSARFGLDCVGLVMAAHRVPESEVPRDYALRGVSRATVEAVLATWFRRVARTRARDGDVLLARVGANVLHLGMRSGTGMIHADLRHGVIERPGPLLWPVVAVYRRRVRNGRER